MTFQDCAEVYIAAHQAGWSNPKHAAQWPSTMARFVYPVFGALSVQAVDTGLVLKVIEPLWTVRTETASRVRGRIEAVLDWAAARGYRQGDNPARWRGHLDHLLPARSKVRQVKHHAALPYHEIGAFMARLRQQDGIAARAFEFLILTCARTDEVIGAPWSEVDFRSRMWIIPAERMKGRREHRVPLSDKALAVLHRMTQIALSDEFIFASSERANQQHEHADAAPKDDAQWLNGAWLPLNVPRLDCRAHQFPVRGRRNGFGARGR
jgi:integrase